MLDNFLTDGESSQFLKGEHLDFRFEVSGVGVGNF